MSEPAGDPGAARTSESEDRKRAKLETEKLELETDKLRSEIRELGKAPLRAAVAAITPVVAILATIIFGVSSYVFNTNVNRAVDEQRVFENYAKLTEQFSKGRAQRVAAVAGLRAFLTSDSDRSRQTAAILANDLITEDDPAAVRAITTAFDDAGAPAIKQVHDVHTFALARMYTAAHNYYIAEAVRWYLLRHPDPQEYTHVAEYGEDTNYADYWRLLRFLVSDPAYHAGHSLLSAGIDEMHRRGLDSANPTAENHLIDSIDEARDTVARDVDAMPFERLESARVRAEFSNAVPAFIMTGVILRSQLESPARVTLDFSEDAIYAATLDDMDLTGVDLRRSYVEGRSRGANLSLADLRRTTLDLDFRHGTAHGSSMCGAALTSAVLKRSREYLRDGTDMPDFTAADWWNLRNLTSRDRNLLERRYPRSQQERLRQLSPTEKRRMCTSRWAR